jgi:hypothetical protein
MFCDNKTFKYASDLCIMRKMIYEIREPKEKKGAAGNKWFYNFTDACNVFATVIECKEMNIALPSISQLETNLVESIYQSVSTKEAIKNRKIKGHILSINGLHWLLWPKIIVPLELLEADGHMQTFAKIDFSNHPRIPVWDTLGNGVMNTKFNCEAINRAYVAKVNHSLEADFLKLFYNATYEVPCPFVTVCKLFEVSIPNQQDWYVGMSSKYCHFESSTGKNMHLMMDWIGYIHTSHIFQGTNVVSIPAASGKSYNYYQVKPICVSDSLQTLKRTSYCNSVRFE